MNVKTQIKFISAQTFKQNLNNNGVQSLYRPIMILDSGIPESTSFWTKSFNFAAEASTDDKISGTMGEICCLSYQTVVSWRALGV